MLGCALTVEPDDIVIGSMCGVVLVSRAPFALAPVKLDRAEVGERQDSAVARRSLGDHLGRRELGRLEPRRRSCLVHLCVLSEIVSVKLRLPFVVTDALSLSPGFTGLLKLTGYFGYISYHA